MQENVVPLPQRTAGIIARDLRKLDKGALRGFVTLHIPAWHLTIKECRWFEKNGSEWIGLPSTSFQNREGKTIYRDLVEFTDKEAGARFQKAALQAIAELR